MPQLKTTLLRSITLACCIGCSPHPSATDRDAQTPDLANLPTGTVYATVPAAIKLLLDDTALYVVTVDGIFYVGDGGISTVVAGDTIWGATLDALYIYYVTQGNGVGPVVSRVPRAGGSAEVLASTTDLVTETAGSMTADSDYVYWLQGSFHVATIRRVSKTGGPETIIQTILGNLNTNQLHVDSNYLYWAGYALGAESPCGTGGSECATVYRALKSGEGTVEAVNRITANGTPLAQDAETLYWRGYDPSALFSDSALVDEIVGMNKLTEQTAVLSLRAQSKYTDIDWEAAEALAVDNDKVYWTVDSLVVDVPLSGGPLAVVAQGSPTGSGLDIAVNRTKLYWLDAPNAGTSDAGCASCSTVRGIPLPQ